MAEHIEVTPSPEIMLEVREHQLTMLLATMAFTMSSLRSQPEFAVSSHALADVLGDLITNAGLDGDLKEIELMDFAVEDDEK